MQLEDTVKKKLGRSGKYKKLLVFRVNLCCYTSCSSGWLMTNAEL